MATGCTDKCLIAQSWGHACFCKTVIVSAKPMCAGCHREPGQIPEYVSGADDEDMTPEEYVVSGEGTYDRRSKLFLCTECYIALDMPTNAWIKEHGGLAILQGPTYVRKIYTPEADAQR